MRRISPSTLRAIERELRELERRRGDLDRAIARLRRIATWLRERRRRPASAGTGGAARAGRRAESVPHSLTDGCRAVLRMHAPVGLTPREVKHLLTESGLLWERFSNPMSAVHTVLKRLVQQHEALATLGSDGRRRYAVKPTVVIALTRREIADNALMDKLLEAGSPDGVVDLLKGHRRKSR
jgi:hypothetical protein